MDKREIKNHLAYTIVLSAVKLPRKSQHPILWLGLIKEVTPIKSQPKDKVVLDTISTSYPVCWIKSICNILH